MRLLADDPESTDTRILRLARSGRKREACELLVRAYGDEILGTCTARMGDDTAGEDAAQDVMARALVGLADYRGQGGLRPWLHRIAANRCVDLLRSRRSRLTRRAEGAAPDALAAEVRPMPREAAEEAADRRARIRRVREALDRIKEPDRTWVELRYTHGVAYDEIAADAGLSRAAVKQRVWRAVKRIRRAVGAEAREDGR